MHIRDEHLRAKGNERLTQRLRERRAQPSQPSALSVTPPQPHPENSSQTAANPPMHTNTSFTDSEEDVDLPEICEISKFRELINAYRSQLQDDEVDNDPIIPLSAQLTNPYPLIPIHQLFDFTDISWSKMINDGSEQNFEAELALYDLLDRDADGEVDVDLDLDGFTEQAYLG